MTTSRTAWQRMLPASALVVAAAVTLAACGGSGGLSRDGFIAKADAVCRDGQAQFRTIQSKAPTSGPEAATQTGKLVGASQTEIKGLRALTPPDSLRTGFDVYLKAREDAIAVLEKGEAAAKRNDPQGYATAKEEIATGQAKRFDLARKVGLEVCSKPEVRAPGKTK